MGYLSSTEAADSSVVRKLAEQAFGRSVGPIVPMVGLVAYNFQVNNDRIFKIASSRSNINDWQRMVVNSPVLQRHLSVEIPMPTLHILQHENREIPAISYERLPGMVITRQMFAEANDTFKKDYIAKLNEKIYELHQVSPDILPARPLSVFQQAANMLFNHKRARKYVPKLTEYLFPYPKHNVLLHTDLHTENICFDGKNITGLLDFDSLSIGHPVFEFRPKLFIRNEDLNMMLDDYTKKHPSEVSKRVARDFVRKFHAIYFLFSMASLIKGNEKGQTRFDDILKTYRRTTARGQS